MRATVALAAVILTVCLSTGDSHSRRTPKCRCSKIVGDLKCDKEDLQWEITQCTVLINTFFAPIPGTLNQTVVEVGEITQFIDDNRARCGTFPGFSDLENFISELIEKLTTCRSVLECTGQGGYCLPSNFCETTPLGTGCPDGFQCCPFVILEGPASMRK